MKSQINALKMVEALPTFKYWIVTAKDEGYDTREIVDMLKKGLKSKAEHWDKAGNQQAAKEKRDYLEVLEKQGLDKYLEFI